MIVSPPTLDELLRSHREKVGVTQENAARQCNVTTRTLQGWEAGRLPRPSHYAAICEVYQVTVEDLLASIGASLRIRGAA